MKEKNLKTDVLILGAGAAGCGAAIAAREQGAGKVMIVEKGKLESSGAIGGGNDHFMAVLNTGPDWDTEETAVNALKGFHTGTTPETIRNSWVRVMPVIVRLLEDMGVEFVKKPDGSYLRTVGFGQPGPWWINMDKGWYVKRHIAKRIHSMGIDVVNNVMVTRLLTSNGRIAGAVGFNVLDGTFYTFRAKTVVLALGANANRTTANSTGNPYNTWHSPYNTGSNGVMAYEGGAKILNLELNEASTLLPKSFGAPGMNGLNSMGGHELNALGERFMGKYDPRWEDCVRRVQVASTYQELIEGKGPPFYMDMRHLSKEDIALLENVLMPGDKATYKDWQEQKKFTFATTPLEVEISEIALGSKLLTNNRFECSVKGLFSGCNFMAFSGAMCGGYSAGKEAAKAAEKIDDLATINNAVVAAEKEQIFKPLGRRTGLSPKQFEALIRQTMTYYMGFVRNQKGIETALEKLNIIQNHIGEVKADNLHELMRANEARHLIKHCQLSARAAMERKESGRTLYRRSDYPKLNPDLNKCFILWQENGAEKMAIKPLEEATSF